MFWPETVLSTGLSSTEPLHNFRIQGRDNYVFSLRCTSEEIKMMGPTSSQKPDGAQTELVYCPMCTHTVQAVVVSEGKRVKVAPGQKCSRCGSQLDAGYVMKRERAA